MKLKFKVRGSNSANDVIFEDWNERLPGDILEMTIFVDGKESKTKIVLALGKLDNVIEVQLPQ